ncbi:MAG: DoxX-like family protein [Bacteroidota bacterium]
MSDRLLTYGIAAVWFVNGLWAKVLGGVPRHQEIVARILGAEYAQAITIAIGLGEVAFALWVLFGGYRKLTATLQIFTILTMNVLETYLARDLLLWGQWNLLFAILFCSVVYVHGFLTQTNNEMA